MKGNVLLVWLFDVEYPNNPIEIWKWNQLTIEDQIHPLTMTYINNTLFLSAPENRIYCFQ